MATETARAVEEAKALILQASDLLRPLGSDLARIAWLLEDTIPQLEEAASGGHDGPTEQFNSEKLAEIIARCG